MGSFSYTIRDYKYNTHENIVGGESVYIGYDGYFVRGVYEDYGNFKIDFKGDMVYINILVIDEYINKKNCSLKKAIKKTARTYEDNENGLGHVFYLNDKMTYKKHEKLRLDSIHRFFNIETSSFSRIKMSMHSDSLDFITNEYDSMQGFEKWTRTAQEEKQRGW